LWSFWPVKHVSEKKFQKILFFLRYFIDDNIISVRMCFIDGQARIMHLRLAIGFLMGVI